MSRKLAIAFVLVAILAAMALPFSPVLAQAQPVVITWFIGLGAGGQPEHRALQDEIVAAFNATHDDIELEHVVVDFDASRDTLSTLIAAGDAPDIIGPVGIGGSNDYAGSFLDLDPIIEELDYDLGRWAPSLIDFYRDPVEGLTGLPFATFPSFVYFNRDLFDAAGVDYPPQTFDEPYADGDPWDVNKLREIAMLLTLDANGNNATSPDFDAANIVQFGYAPQWWGDDIRSAVTSPFGAGTFFDAETGQAVMPENWREGIKWLYQGWHTDRFIPDYAYNQSDLLLGGNVFNSNRVAMAYSHLWYTCCLGDVPNWDIAVVPSFNDTYTSKLHADTFRILKYTEHPVEAFKVLDYLVAGEAMPRLLQVYGAAPSDEVYLQPFLTALDGRFAQGVNWDVVLESANYPDNPSHEGWMPNYMEAVVAIKNWSLNVWATPGLDIDAEMEALLATLQPIFDAAP
jgi:multiple sugar transport system substrate-binding protein